MLRQPWIARRVRHREEKKIRYWQQKTDAFLLALKAEAESDDFNKIDGHHFAMDLNTGKIQYLD